jgi:hypothetical protein
MPSSVAATALVAAFEESTPKTSDPEALIAAAWTRALNPPPTIAVTRGFDRELVGFFNMKNIKRQTNHLCQVLNKRLVFISKLFFFSYKTTTTTPVSDLLMGCKIRFNPVY